MALSYQNIVKAARLSIQTNVPLLVAGPTGVGKTAAMEEAVKTPINLYGQFGEMTYDIRVTETAGMDETDLLGMPSTINEGGREVTVWARPDFVVPFEASYADVPPTLYFLDEISRAPRQVRHALMNALHRQADGYRYIGTHKVRELDRFVLAYNPADDGYDTEDLDPALIARCSHVLAMAKINEWREYAHKKKLNQTMVTFLLDHTADDEPLTECEDFKPQVKKTFRSMEKAIEVFEFWEKNLQGAKDKYEVTPNLLAQFLSGLVGTSAMSLPEYLRDNSWAAWPAEDLINKPKREITKYLKALKDHNRNDILTHVTNGLQAYIKSVACEKEDYNRIVEVFELLPNDMWAKIVDYCINNAGSDDDNHSDKFLAHLSRMKSAKVNYLTEYLNYGIEVKDQISDDSDVAQLGVA